MPNFRLLVLLLAMLTLAGCASRPINERLTQFDPQAGYRPYLQIQKRVNNDPRTLFILAFSGGGTRAAALSYGVLDELRRTEIVIDGQRRRLIDEVDIITGVSGGSFTALAYALYGDRLFSEYEERFLKRDVQGALVSRALNPFNWWKYIGGSAGRSELAAELYDEILFDGATYADLHPEAGSGCGRQRDRHLHGVTAFVLPERLRPSVLRLEQGAPLPRGRHVLRGTGRAIGGDVRQLRRHLRLRVSGVGPRRRQDRGSREAVGAGAATLSRDAGVPEQQGPPVHPPRRWRRRGQHRHAQRARGARGAWRQRGVSRRGRLRRPQADRARRRELALGAEYRLGPQRIRPAPLRNCCSPPACPSTASRSKPSRS